MGQMTGFWSKNKISEVHYIENLIKPRFGKYFGIPKNKKLERHGNP